MGKLSNYQCYRHLLDSLKRTNESVDDCSATNKFQILCNHPASSRVYQYKAFEAIMAAKPQRQRGHITSQYQGEWPRLPCRVHPNWWPLCPSNSLRQTVSAQRNKDGLLGASNLCQYNTLAIRAGNFAFFGCCGYLISSFPRGFENNLRIYAKTTACMLIGGNR